MNIEFPERKGALRDLSSYYFNSSKYLLFQLRLFRRSRIGRALMGFEFTSPENKAKIPEDLMDEYNRQWQVKSIQQTVTHEF